MKRILSNLFFTIACIGSLFGQDAMSPLDFTCIDCNLSAELILLSENDCGVDDLQLELQIEGEYDEIFWQDDDTEKGISRIVQKNSGIYTVEIKKGVACVVTATFDSDGDKLNEQFFKDNCFLAIPVGFDLEGGSGRSNALMVEIEGIEQLVNVQAIFDLANINNAFFSTDCDGYMEGLGAYEGGQAWAHIAPNNDEDEDDLPTLYLGIKGGSNNTFGERITNAYFDFWNDNSTEDALTAPLNYTCGSGQFLESKFGNQWIDYILSVYECEDFSPKQQGKGIIPHCLWKEFPEPINYYDVLTDIPFAAGMIDATYQQFQDLPELIKLIEDLISHNLSLQGYIICRLGGIDEDFYDRLGQKVDDPDFLDYLKVGFDYLLSGTPYNCTEAFEAVRKHKEIIVKIGEFITNKDAVLAALATIGQKLSEYYTELTTCNDLITCNNARYEHGKLTLNLLSIALGIGAEDAILHFGRILTRLPISQIGDFFAHASRANKVKRLTPDRKLVYQDALDVLPPKAMDKVVDNPELLDVWARMGKKACPLLVSRSSSNKCEELRKKIFTNLEPDLIKKFELDADNTDFYKYFTDNNDQADNWKKFATIKDNSKLWVRKNIDLYKRIKSKELPSTDVDKLRDFYSTIRLPQAKPGTIITGTRPNITVTKEIEGYGQVSITYDKFGFPNFDNYIPGPPKSEFAIDVPLNPWGGRTADIKHANSELLKKYNQPNNNLPQDYKVLPNNKFSITKNGNEVKYTWHHHQDSNTLIPIPTKIHNSGSRGFAHSGGDALLRNEIRGFFDGPELN